MISGAITMWSGSLNNIPEGWVLCDGSNGTPDLRDRFVVGVGSGYSLNSTGGSNSVTLSTNQLPSHSHSISVTSDATSHTHSTNISGVRNLNNYSQPGSNNLGYTNYTTVSTSGTNPSNLTHSHAIQGTSDSVGGGTAHENRPAYYALAFIMAVG
jgi:microcystin-dependent protein